MGDTRRMTRPFPLLVTLSVAATALAGSLQRGQTAPPDTEIFLASLTADGDLLKLGTPANISNSPGYDNQPSFTPDGSAILFTSVRGAAPPPAGGRPLATDIYRFDIASRSIRQVTSTPEGEYSPTVTPDGRHISVIRVESDGTQRLWRFTLDGKEPELVLRDVKPVGYHAWLDDRQLALFVLGEPPTLQVADGTTGMARIVAKDVGRSLQRVPEGGISFVQVERETGGRDVRSLTIMELDREGRVTRPLIAGIPGATEADIAWSSRGTLLVAHGDKLHAWRRGKTSWSAVADLAALGLRGVSRLAVSPAGDRIALVVAQQTR